MLSNLQDAIAVPLAQAGPAQDLQNVDGSEQPAAVVQVPVPPAQPVPEPNADVVSSPSLLLAHLAFFLLSATSMVFCGRSLL